MTDIEDFPEIVEERASRADSLEDFLPWFEERFIHMRASPNQKAFFQDYIEPITFNTARKKYLQAHSSHKVIRITKIRRGEEVKSFRRILIFNSKGKFVRLPSYLKRARYK